MANAKFETLKARLKSDPDKLAWLEERAAIRQLDRYPVTETDKIALSEERRTEAEELACKDWFDAGVNFFKVKEKKA